MRYLRYLVYLMLLAAASPTAARDKGPVEVSHSEGHWVIAGRKQKVLFNDSDYSIKVEAGPVVWEMAPSSHDDLLVRFREDEFHLSLSEATESEVIPYDTGYKSGIKLRLGGFRSKGMYHQGSPLDLVLILTLALEGEDEDLVSTVVAIEQEAKVRQLDWPKEVRTEASSNSFTALPHVRGNLLPGNWPEPYHPFGSNVPSADQMAFAGTETSYIQSNLIETWSMSWWGFQKDQSAMMLIVETPDDASYKFSHPAGGPTVMGPRWLASLGELAYPRSVRMCFFSPGNYVTMAKRYRKYVQDIGQFVSLKEKIAREPRVAKLVGTPHIRMHILRNYREEARRYDHENPENNYRLTTFDESARQLSALKEKGIPLVYATLAGWPKLGYDRQHPDVLPPAPEAGGWKGLEKWFDTVKKLGYMANLHDQYRDYYTDAPSYDPQFAIHEEDNIRPPTVFPGTRFGTWKEGYLPFMDYWDGGLMTYLNPRFALGHLIKNYQELARHGIRPDGSYLDVFGYVPPTQDFNPEHPLTRRGNMDYRALMFRWAANNLGIVGTEDGADWVIPYVDYATDANEGSVIPVPLYNLVYHDAIMTPAGGTGDFLRCLLNGGYPTVPRDMEDEQAFKKMRIISALHKRVALLEMTGFEYLDKDYTKARSTFSDGTTVTVDKRKGTYKITPPLTLN